MYLSFEQEVKLCRAFLLAKGLDDTDAGILADSVAYSDFTGIYSHGLSRFANYLQRFANGAYAVDAKLTPVSDTGSTAVFDCGNGCGVIAVSHVYEKMRERARRYGIVIAAGGEHPTSAAAHISVVRPLPTSSSCSCAATPLAAWLRSAERTACSAQIPLS